MIVVLLFLLIALDVLCFIFFDRNILSPSVLAVSMFVLSTFVAVLNIEAWKFTLSAYTVVMIMTSLLALVLGEFLVRLFFYRRRQSAHNYIPENPIKIHTGFIVFICIVLSLLCMHYLQELMRLAVAAGYTNSEGALFVAYVRTASLKPEIYGTVDRIAGWSSTLATVFAYVFLYIIWYNKIYCNTFNFLFLIPVITFLPYTVFSGGRTQFIYLIAFSIIVGGTFYLQKHRWKIKSMFKILKAGVLGIAAFFVIFIAVGSLKSSTIVETALSTISFYTGLSIPSLDDYFLHPRPEGEYFGEHVLFGIYAFLREFDESIPDFYAPYDFVSFNGTKGNVYTVIRRYHEDFGIAGLYGMMFFLGFFYSLFYLKVNKRSCYGLLLYGFIIAPIVEASIEERFFMSIVSHSKFAVLILMYCIFLLLCNVSFQKQIKTLFRYKQD